MKQVAVVLATLVIGAFLLLCQYQSSLTNFTQSAFVTNNGPSMNDYRNALNLIRDLNETLHRPTKNKVVPLQDGICSTFEGKRTQDLWMEHLHQLVEWSIHPFDDDRLFHDLHAQLLYIISPDRVARAVKSLPHRYWSSVKSAMQVVQRRKEALARNETGDDDAPSKLHILVMGGSVAEGDMCNPRIKQDKRQQRRRNCAWPFRLQFLLDRILGEDLVHVTTATVGGTNSEAALALLDYDLVPKDVHVVIHAYATNDMHAYTLESAAANNVTLADRVFELTEQFVRRVLSRCHRGLGPPLLIYLDDYLGNEQKVIRDTAVIAQTIPLLATYYGFVHVSYADAIRDLVYGDTGETFFSPFWKVLNDEGLLFREIHPGMGAHVTTSFLLLYSILHVITNYCNLRDLHQWRNGTFKYEPVAGLPRLNMSLKTHKHFKVPKETPKGLPPQLYPNLTLDDISKEWRNAPVSRDCSFAYENRCIFAWVARITNNCMIPTQLDDTIAQYAVENHGWTAELDFKKLGLVPINGTKSSLVLEFTHLEQPVSSIMISVMKSYGEKWSNSTVQLKAFGRKSEKRNWNELRLSVSDFTGYHGKKTSEQYSYTSQLLDGPTTNDFRISLQLVAGNTSKIMGMAVCSS